MLGGFALEEHMQIEKVSVDKLKAAAYNPRKELKPGDPEYEKLKRSIGHPSSSTQFLQIV